MLQFKYFFFFQALKIDVVIEGVNGIEKPANFLHGDLSGSQSSLESNLSRTPGHSRQNSQGSLKDVMELRERKQNEHKTSGIV